MTRQRIRGWVGHSPRGECGLKYSVSVTIRIAAGHSPRGECGLKYYQKYMLHHSRGHSPRGECGLKFSADTKPAYVNLVIPLAGNVD